MIPVMIVTVLNQYDKLQRMFDSVDYPIEHAIVMDNSGQLKNIKCDFIKEISIINFPYNLGISIPYNLGIKLTPMAQYWLLTQDDVIWNPGGLERVHQLSGSDNFCIGISDQRPFACRTMGENVVAKVGLLDESFFPAPGDEYNYHKRCHYNNIKEVDITGTFIAELSSTIINLINDGTIESNVWNKNFHRSMYDPPIDHGWNLFRRREQESKNNVSDDEQTRFKEIVTKRLRDNYTLHNEWENVAFMEYNNLL
jgi:hypothetical protein